jgi:predicted RND superfamily exporter protein
VRGSRVAEWLVDHRRVVAVVLLVATLAVGSAAGQVEMTSDTGDFQTESTASKKLDEVRERFAVDGQNTTLVQVVVRDENVLSRASLRESLALQAELRENRTVSRTLVDEQPIRGVGNLVAVAAIRAEVSEGGGPPPEDLNTSLAAQRAQLRSMSDDEVARVVERVLAANPDGSNPALSLMPTDYQPGTASADARLLLVFQYAPGDVSDPPDRIVDAQVTMQSLAEDRYGDRAFVFGVGIVQDETGRAIGDSFTIIGPLALLLVLVTLVVAYRDVLDIVLGMAGIGLVLVWTFGAMGWLGIEFNTILIAVPILLIGLAIDYSIHVFMRYREARTEHPDDDAVDGMGRALAGVGLALVWVTVTTAFGFLSNLTSPLPPLQDFGLVSAIGIVASLLVFGGLVPAVKVEADRLLERFGFDRRKAALGAESGGFARLLAVGNRGARLVPGVVVAVALVLALAGGYAGAGVDTTFDRSDFITEEPPGWMKELPEPFAPGEYSIRENAAFLNGRFLQESQSSKAEILIEGSVTEPDALDRVQATRDEVAAQPVTVTLADDSPAIAGPIATIRQVAAENDSFAATVAAADTDDDGVPDRNLTAVYDHLYEVAPEQARQVVAREDGDYTALRLTVSVRGDAQVDDVRDQLRGAVGPTDGDGLESFVTGDPVLTAVVQDRLLSSIVVTLVVTTLAVLAVLVVGYRFLEGSATLGAVTLIPVLLALAWVLGTMRLLAIPFNAQTALITSLGIGLGVDYSIHVSERFKSELDDLGDVDRALERTVGGTGGALLGSAITTASGFSVLALAIVPSLQRFGIVIGLAIVYAFLAAVFVLPSVLVFWARAFGDVQDEGAESEAGESTSEPM